MYFQMFRNICLVISLTCFYSVSSGINRNIKCNIYSGGSSDIIRMNIIHIIATDAEDAVHYVWSSYKLPSIIVARTSLDTELRIDFVKLQTFEGDAVQFSKKPLDSIGVTISELWESSYKSDDSPIEDVVSSTPLNLESFDWADITNETLCCSKASADITMTSFNDDSWFSKNGTFKIKFSVAGDKKMSTDFPHLMYNGNSTQMKVLLEKLHSNSSRTRYGLEIMVSSSLSHTSEKNPWKTTTTRSISDEFSPGTFQDVLLSPPYSNKDGNESAFLTWRPVAYTDKIPTVADSSDAKISSHFVPVNISMARSIAEVYFKEQPSISSSMFNITFGTVGDGFYPKTEYTSWLFMVGTGTALKNTLSATAIIFISVGLGALMLFFLSGAIFLLVRSCRVKDDDLLLSDGSIN